MSLDFLDRVVEGFPFLLAPLSQVKGVTSPVVSHSSAQNDVKSNGNSFFRTIGGFGGVISSQASTLADLFQNGAHEISAGAIESAKSVGLAARNLGEEVEQRRQMLGKHVLTFTSQAMSSFYPKDQKSLSIPYQWISDQELSRISGELYRESQSAKAQPGGRFSEALCRSLGLDVFSLSARNATQKLFFSFLHFMVHLYLLLLLISSFPAQQTTRVKLTVPKKSMPGSSCTDSSDSEDSDESFDYSVGVREAPLTCRDDVHIKKRFVL